MPLPNFDFRERRYTVYKPTRKKAPEDAEER